MAIEANKASAIAIIRGIFQARLERGLISDDAVWWMQGRGELSIDDFEESFRKFHATHTASAGQFELHGITAEDDRVAVEAECAVPLKSGSIYRSTYHFLFRFRKGKAFLIKEYFDTASARDAFRSGP